MQETSSLYKRLLADPGHWKEYTLVIGESGVLVTNQGDRITFGSKSYNAEVRGSVIQLEGTTENPLTGLRIFGKTTQNGTPTPEAPAALESVGESVTVTTCGKNLLNNSSGQWLVSGCTADVLPDGGVKINGSNASYTALYRMCTLRLKPGKYFLSGCPAGGSGSTYAVSCEKAQGGFVGYDTGNGLSITVTEEMDYSFFVRLQSGYTANNLIFYPQLEIGSVATEYEPYNEQILSISTPNGLPGIPVSSGGNYTDEKGQQWVCDEVDFEKGVYVQRIGTTTLSKEDTWAWNTMHSCSYAYVPGGKITGNDTQFMRLVSSNKYVGTSWVRIGAGYGDAEYHCAFIYGISQVGFYDKDCASVADFLAKLGDNSIEVQYVLNSYTETTLTAEQLAAYAALRTQYPNTTIFNDAGADMIVGYLLNGEGPINILVASTGADSGFRESSIISMSTQKSIFSDSNPTVGNCIAGQITAEIMRPKGDIPRRARLAPYVRLTNGKEHSEWLPKGVFFIDHREYSGDENERMVINGYDHIILTEDDFPSSTNEWPRTDIDVVRDIASEIGTAVDSRTVQIMNKGYKINYPAEYSMREVLENIAAMYAGSFVMSDIGELLLVTMFGIPKETNYLIDNVGFAITFGGDRILV